MDPHRKCHPFPISPMGQFLERPQAANGSSGQQWFHMHFLLIKCQGCHCWNRENQSVWFGEGMLFSHIHHQHLCGHIKGPGLSCRHQWTTDSEFNERSNLSISQRGRQRLFNSVVTRAMGHTVDKP